MTALFSLGHVVATPGALAALERANQSPAYFLARHATGDWGELDASDIAENEYSVANGFQLLSSYLTGAGEKLLIITEADRSATTLYIARGVLTSAYPGGFQMTHLRDRKNRLSFVTNSTARYRGREREIVMEVFPEYASVRLLGRRTRYEVSWRAIFDLAAEIRVRRERQRKLLA